MKCSLFLTLLERYPESPAEVDQSPSAGCNKTTLLMYPMNHIAWVLTPFLPLSN